MTHVEVPTNFTSPTGHIDLNGDGIGYVKSYDFSTANLSNEHRIAAISTVASVCYQSPKAAGSISLYNRLANESAGLPSSSFEFVPVLLKAEQAISIGIFTESTANVLKYGESILDDTYVLTNLRALISDVGDQADQFFNTPEECEIIAEHFKVFKSKVDLSTRSQYIRHRASWQELSRRYVSGKKSAFEFYISPKMESVVSSLDDSQDPDYQTGFNTADLISVCIEHYDEAIAQGVKPEEARRILPQCMYTTVWSAWQPKQLDVFFKLRLDKHAQVEIRHLAEAKQQLLKGN
jgi:thymidylate synthase (FAD)